MSTPEECKGAKPEVSLSERGLVRTSCSNDAGPHMEADDGHATHWVWHFSMQVHCKPRRNVQKQCSLTRVGAGDKLQTKRGCHALQTSGCGCCTHCRQELQAGHTVQTLAAGVIQIAGRGCGYHTRSSHRLWVPNCEQLLWVLHTVQAQPQVTHALQTWAAGGVPGWGQHTLGSRRLRVSGHPLWAGLRVLHAVQTEVCGWGTRCSQGCKCLKRWTLYGRFPTAEREVTDAMYSCCARCRYARTLAEAKPDGVIDQCHISRPR